MQYPLTLPELYQKFTLLLSISSLALCFCECALFTLRFCSVFWFQFIDASTLSIAHTWKVWVRIPAEGTYSTRGVGVILALLSIGYFRESFNLMSCLLYLPTNGCSCELTIPSWHPNSPRWQVANHERLGPSHARTEKLKNCTLCSAVGHGHGEDWHSKFPPSCSIRMRSCTCKVRAVHARRYRHQQW